MVVRRKKAKQPEMQPLPKYVRCKEPDDRDTLRYEQVYAVVDQTLVDYVIKLRDNAGNERLMYFRKTRFVIEE